MPDKLLRDQELGIEKSFRETERQGEIPAAIFRVLIAMTMLLAAWVGSSAGYAGHPLIMVALVYALVSVLGLVLALARVFHPLLPYAFVSLDCMAIALALTMLAQMHGLDMVHEFSLPIFSLAFVVLIHAALRYRPWLVVFGALLFITLLFILPGLLALVPAIMPMEHGGIATAGTTAHGQQDPLPHDIGLLPLIFLILAAGLLYFIVNRTRGLARLALLDGQRVAQLTRFFSPEVANRIVADPQSVRSEAHTQPVAILFIDIRGFTSLSENMSPDGLTEMLASFRSFVCQIVFDHGGTVDKFIGDAVLVVFGTPTARADDASRAVRAALAVGKGIRRWHDERSRNGSPAALVGIGAHYGEVFAGVIESGSILEHTVIGDAVNVAQRLERLSRTFGSDVVLSNEIVIAAGIKPGSLGLSRKKNVKITGHKATATVYHAKLAPET